MFGNWVFHLTPYEKKKIPIITLITSNYLFQNAGFHQANKQHKDESLEVMTQASGVFLGRYLTITKISLNNNLFTSM